MPVDLNAIICGNLQLMGDLYDAIGDIDGSKYCAQTADLLRQTIHQVGCPEPDLRLVLGEPPGNPQRHCFDRRSSSGVVE